jgi:hypothetical protein
MNLIIKNTDIKMGTRLILLWRYLMYLLFCLTKYYYYCILNAVKNEDQEE